MDLSAVRRPRVLFKLSAPPMWVVDVRPPGKKPYFVLTPTADEKFGHGLAPEAIAGTFRGTRNAKERQEPRRENFIAGPLFTSFLQSIIARYTPDLPEYQSLAAEQGDGWRAIRAGLVDEYHLLIAPIIAGSGNPYLPGKVAVKLELLDERRFDNGMVHVRYRAQR